MNNSINYRKYFTTYDCAPNGTGTGEWHLKPDYDKKNKKSCPKIWR